METSLSVKRKLFLIRENAFTVNAEGNYMDKQQRMQSENYSLNDKLGMIYQKYVKIIDLFLKFAS